MKRFAIITLVLSLAMITMAQTERFCIAKNNKTAKIIVDENDWYGVLRAANDLGDDVRKVTNIPSLVIVTNSSQVNFNTLPNSIIVGTIGKSKVIDKLIKQKKIGDRFSSYKEIAGTLCKLGKVHGIILGTLKVHIN